jgi:hypothetical protein
MHGCDWSSLLTSEKGLARAPGLFHDFDIGAPRLPERESIRGWRNATGTPGGPALNSSESSDRDGALPA